jgi:hypothetical protein
MKHNVVVYGPLRVKARTIKDTKLRWKIPKNFPDEHRPSNGLYTVCLLHNSVDKVRGKLSHQA